MRYLLENAKKASQNPEYPDEILALQCCQGTICSQHVADVQLFVFIFPMGWYRYVRKNYLTWIKNNENPALVYEKVTYHILMWI